LKEIIKILKRKKYKNIERIEFLPNFSDEDIKNFYKDPQYVPKKYRRFCFAPYLGLSILPDGNVWSCPDYVIGNIKRESFKEIWNSEKIKKLRKRIKEKGIFPICHTCASLYIY
jgi:MoaA/NifB/PqqE/SkfB family radical SAM enzyme